MSRPANRYVVVRHLPGRRWQPEVPFSDQDGIDEHVSYWKRLFETGLVELGGPFPDGTGGLMVLDADLGSATKLAAHDPAVEGALLVAEVHEWIPVFRRREGDAAHKPTARSCASSA